MSNSIVKYKQLEYTKTMGQFCQYYFSVTPSPVIYRVLSELSLDALDRQVCILTMRCDRNLQTDDQRIAQFLVRCIIAVNCIHHLYTDVARKILSKGIA
jgi:hypothetical protein